jgi:hypothetical protein
MRNLPKVLVVMFGLFALAFSGVAVRANNVRMGSFTLQHPTQWNNTVLPAGDYTFEVARTQTNAHLLVVHGAKQSLSVYIYSESACVTCRNSSLNLEVHGNNRAVSSLELSGLHVNFKVRQSASEKEEMSKMPASNEQVAVQTDSN